MERKSFTLDTCDYDINCIAQLSDGILIYGVDYSMLKILNLQNNNFDNILKYEIRILVSVNMIFHVIVHQYHLFMYFLTIE